MATLMELVISYLCFFYFPWLGSSVKGLLEAVAGRRMIFNEAPFLQALAAAALPSAAVAAAPRPRPRLLLRRRGRRARSGWA